MATADRPRSSALDPATRQQLDELDELMQRMLALPVNPPEDLPPPLPQPSPGATVSEGASTPLPLTAPATPLEPEQSSKENEPANRGAAVQSPPSVTVLHRTGMNADSAGGSNPSAESAFRRVPSPAAPLRLAWPLRPLLWLNLAFDYCTAWLGPLGRWLREPGGRALLGWGGLLLLAAALAWLAWDGIGWTW